MEMNVTDKRIDVNATACKVNDRSHSPATTYTEFTSVLHSDEGHPDAFKDECVRIYKNATNKNVRVCTLQE